MRSILNTKTMRRPISFVEAIRAGGHRLTRQRRVILEILEESREHLDAETLYARARARDARISLATVYRALALLKETGLVQEHRLGEDHGHFEAMHETPHYHFTCIGCGKVIEFEAPQVLEISRKLREEHDLLLLEIHLHISGRCSSCRSRHDIIGE